MNYDDNQAGVWVTTSTNQNVPVLGWMKAQRKKLTMSRTAQSKLSGNEKRGYKMQWVSKTPTLRTGNYWFVALKGLKNTGMRQGQVH